MLQVGPVFFFLTELPQFLFQKPKSFVYRVQWKKNEDIGVILWRMLSYIIAKKGEPVSICFLSEM
jgi:hypothetical protein